MFYSAGRTSPTRPYRAVVRTEDPVKIRRGATKEEIASLAYSYWLAGGRREGNALSDWLQAERVLNDR